jgi:glyoxylase-like metal-dependent hydrolase (beta-lactamase superfamily II)
MSIESAFLGENCWLLAEGDGSPALVVDPGLGVAEAINRASADHDLTVTAVLATHGHIDHIADAHALADHWQAPLYIHPADRDLLTRPELGLDAAAAAYMGQLFAAGLAEPQTVVELAEDRQVLDLAGFAVTAFHAPGHQPGCVIFRVAAEGRVLAFTGDVLFAGSIGRTDFKRGSMVDMVRTLRDVVLGGADGQLHLADDAVVLPGHGPHTTMADERAANPYLQPRFLEAAV